MSMLNPTDDELLAVYAAKLRFWAVTICAAHESGVGGGVLKPWSCEFQEEAAAVYVRCLPVLHCSGTATNFSVCAEALGRIVSADDECRDTAVAYFSTAASALSSRVGRSNNTVLFDENPWTPAIVPFVEIATHACPIATIELLRAAEWIVQTCHKIQLTNEEVTWLAALLTESTVVEMASQNALSERSMYRRLNGLYKKLDADNRHEAIAAAVEAGYSRSLLSQIANRLADPLVR